MKDKQANCAQCTNINRYILCSAVYYKNAISAIDIVAAQNYIKKKRQEMFR